MIQIENLSKTFYARRGAVEAVRRVSFECRPGEVFGLLGPNGAGKTTLLRLISTALRPSAGGGRVMDFDLRRQAAQVRRQIGFLSANTGLYGRLTPREVLTYFGRLFRIDPPALRERITEIAPIFKLEDFIDRPCDKLSTGMRQRVNIARTVVHAPPVLVLDEPTAGLDVLSNRSIIHFIRDCRSRQKTVVFSTHVMSEVEQLCDRVGILHEGRLFFCGTLAEIRARYGDDLNEAFIKMIQERE